MTTLQDMLDRRRRASSKGPSQAGSQLHFGSDPISEDPASPISLRVIVFTYERPDSLDALLRDIEACREHHEISVVVYDDASRANYAVPRATLERLGGAYIRSPRNHGKRQFWRWVSHAYSDQRARTERLYVTLPDDMRLCDRFFDRVLNTWRRIIDPHKVALNLCRDDSRDGKTCWTDQVPIDCGPVFDVGWVDGAVLCNRRYFSALGWKLRPVRLTRWSENPLASSGVGQQISLRLSGKGLHMYGVKRSLVAHVGGPSKMNPIERRQNPLRALHFIDGEDAHQRLAGAPRPRVSPPLSRTRARRRHRFVPTSHVGGVRKKK